jgi:hypothetical protein
MHATSSAAACVRHGRQARSRSNGVSPRRSYFNRREMSAAV